jgi:hypothetical protein
METVAQTVKEEIEFMLDELKIARDHAQGLRDERRQMIEEIQATPAYKALSEAGTEADQTIEIIEANIREVTLALHMAGATIPERTNTRKKTTVDIPSELSAKTWCIDNFTPALALDKKAFEDAVKKGQIPAVLATVKTETTITIATKL